MTYSSLFPATSPRPTPVIMLVEDNPADLRLASEVLGESLPQAELMIARDGEQALKMIRREGDYCNLNQPDLILLDLNLPRKDGREVLREIKQDPVLRRIPVLILSTSSAEKDVLVCYNAHANAYLIKPANISEFSDLARVLREFWLGMVQPAPKAVVS